MADSTTLSAFWIFALIVDATPAGFKVVDGVFHVTSCFEVIVNPSFPSRLTHMLLASFLTVAFFLAGVRPLVCERWFVMPQLIALLPIPVMTAAALIAMRIVPNSSRIRGKSRWMPFTLVATVFMLGFGLACSVFPYS